MAENMGMLRLEMHVDRIMPGEWGEKQELRNIALLCGAVPMLTASDPSHFGGVILGGRAYGWGGGRGAEWGELGVDRVPIAPACARTNRQNLKHPKPHCPAVSLWPQAAVFFSSESAPPLHPGLDMAFPESSPTAHSNPEAPSTGSVGGVVGPLRSF